MEKQNDVLVVVLEQMAWQSFISDVMIIGGFVFLAGTIQEILAGIGIYLDSKIMEYVGGVLGVLFLVTIASNALGKNRRMTPDEAIVYIGDVMAKRGEK